MPIAYAVVRAHNGTISVRSARGQGTTLAVRLPFNPETQLEAGSEQGATLLVVDDDSASRRATAAILEHFGFQTVQASDGPQAIERFQQRPERFTAVIVHLKEPGLSQEETSRAIAAIRPDVTILAASNGALVDFTRPETKALLGKSFTPDQLARVLMASGVGKQA